MKIMTSFPKDIQIIIFFHRNLYFASQKQNIKKKKSFSTEIMIHFPQGMKIMGYFPQTKIMMLTH